MSKTYNIPKMEVWEAWKEVKRKGGGAGIDGIEIAEFERSLKDNLYRIWNRMASGSYFPPAVRCVEIPKKSGGKRRLGVPTVGDRVAQAVATRVLTGVLEPVFLPDSYGYRTGKSAHDAIAVTRQRCWKWSYVLEFDVKGLFDNISHELMLRAIRHHIKEPWVLLYVERWLKAPMKMTDGKLVERTAGTPQGGVVSPVIANLFMHYAFDKWMQREFPSLPWCRYADDGLVHCSTFAQAQMILERLGLRMRECGLEIHPDKTRIVYCGTHGKRDERSADKFSFLGFEFRKRLARNQKTRVIFLAFTPAMSPQSLKAIREEVRATFTDAGTHVSLEQIGLALNPKIRGWINYYGRFNPSSMAKVSLYLNQRIMNWARHKFGGLFRRPWARWQWLQHRFRERPKLFVHWEVFPVCSRKAG